MIIATDMDLTMVRTDIPWLQWCDDVCGVKRASKILKQANKLPYNIADLYPEFTEISIDPYCFWENNFLYETMKPIEGCVEALYDLKMRGHTLGIVSKTMKGHYSSKVKFIKRWFPFIQLNGKSRDFFIATHEKYAVKMDCLIDDRLDNFSKIDDEVLKIFYKTPYEQYVKQDVDFSSSSWAEIRDFIQSMEED